MTVICGTAARPPSRDVRPARGWGRVCVGGCHTASKGIAARTITAGDAYRRGCVAYQYSAFVPSAR